MSRIAWLSAALLFLLLSAVIGGLLPSSYPAGAANPGWTWDNPLPTGNDLYDIYCLEAKTCWAVGALGAMVKTTDGGSTWTLQNSGTNESLNAVYFANGATGWAVGSGGAILKTTDGGATWSSQNSGTTDSLLDLDFVDTDVGWAVGASPTGTVLKTTDGGSTWQRLASPTASSLNGDDGRSGASPGQDITAVEVIDRNRVFVVRANDGTIWRTFDGATLVPAHTSPSGKAVRDITCPDENVCLAVGNDYLVWTLDAGNVWVPEPLEVANTLFDVDCSDVDHCAAVGSLGAMAMTSDGGTTWSYAGIASPILYAVDVTPDNRIMVSAAGGGIQGGSLGASELTPQFQGPRVNFGDAFIKAFLGLAHPRAIVVGEAGSTWEWYEEPVGPYEVHASALITRTSGTSQNLYGVDCGDANSCWAVGGGGAIVKSSDGGSTWSLQSSGTTNLLYDVDFVDASTGWVVGFSGTIRKTTDGGSTWSAQTSSTTAGLTGLRFLDADKGWVVGTGGAILRTMDGGTTWTPQVSGASNTLQAVDCVDADTCVAVGYSGTILRTTNGGATWSPQTSGVPWSNLSDVDCADANNCWVVGTGGTILKTTNGGATWASQTGVTNRNLNAVACRDANTCWVAGDAGTLLSTTSAGEAPPAPTATPTATPPPTATPTATATATPTPTPTPVPTTVAIGSDGGALTTSNGSATVTVPPAAVTSTTNFAYTPESPPPPQQGRRAIAAFSLNASNATSGVAVTVFGQPLTITVRYSDGDVAGIEESALAIFRNEQGQWVALPTTVDAPNNTATSTLSSLSQFSLQGRFQYGAYLAMVTKQLATGW